MATYEIHTDGCVLPGNKGGWAYTLEDASEPDTYWEYSGSKRCSDPHTMELQAVVNALQATLPGDRVDCYTDSDYVYQYAPPDQPPRGGRDSALWKSVNTMCDKRDVTWHKISSGSTELNRVCDQKARDAARNFS